MVICKIWDADYPWDVRVEKVCRSLRQKNEVHLVCRNTKGQPTHEESDGIHIHRLPCLRLNLRRINHALGFPAFFNPLWIIAVWRVVRRHRADVILVRDLPLALTALLVGWWERVPVIMDMAENYPAMIEDLWSKEFHLKNLFLRNPRFVRLVEKICVRYVDHILVVVEESRRRLLAMGVPSNKISLVMNTPTLERLAVDRKRFADNGKGSLHLVYLGLLEWPRGVETAIRAVHKIRTGLPGIRLSIIGSGRDEDSFKSLVVELGVTDQVQFLGWLDYSAAIEHVSSADVGLVPHHATRSWNSTIPNKLFDYMSLGKPVIVSNAKPAERIVTEENCGVVFEDRNADGLADAILQLSDRRYRQALGARGQTAVVGKYNWSVDEERLFRAIEKFAYARKLVECVE
jgi:glycosyltransferase involved in cell wall biosynthesis